MRVFTLLFSIVALSCALGTAEESPSEARIAELVRNLGADAYAVRVAARKALFEIGEPARKALEEVVKSRDFEVRHLAHAILADLNRGIRPTWPAELIKLARNYDEMPEKKRLEIIEQLTAKLRLDAAPFLLSCLAADRPREAKPALRHLEKMADSETWRRIIKTLRKPDGPFQVRALALAVLQVGTLDQLVEVLSMEGLDASTRNRSIDECVKRLIRSLKGGEFATVTKTASDLARAVPNEARFLYLQAYGEGNAKRTDVAGELAAKALALNPEDEAPHYVAAKMLQDLGNDVLAIREWEKILEIAPKDEVYDMNALLGLAAIRAKHRQHARAADHYAEVLRLYREARKTKGSGVGLAGASEEQLEARIARLRELGRQHRQAGSIQVHVRAEVVGGKPDEARRLLSKVDGAFSMNVQPYGFRLFEKTPATLKYDPVKKEFTVMLRDSVCGDPIPFRTEKEKIQMAVRILDYCYIFDVNAVTGVTKKLAGFEKNYVVTVKPDAQLAQWKDVTAHVGDTKYEWSELTKGASFDYLPKRFILKLEGTDPAGVQQQVQFEAAVSDPGIPPAAEPEEEF